MLLSLVEDILDIAKLDNGAFELQICSFSVLELINEVYSVFQIQAKAKGIKLKF